MRVLFVCFPYSVHAARWTRLLDDLGWDLHVFPSQVNDGLHATFRDITYWPAGQMTAPLDSSVRIAEGGRGATNVDELADYLAETIAAHSFDIVHSMEFQHAGYLTLAVAKRLGDRMPTWIATNYGSDILLYGKHRDHRDRIRELLERCDYYSAECHRDLALARKMGFRGKVFAIEPNGGGVDQTARRFAQKGRTSERRIVAVKGYQHFAGRALTALESVRRCRHELAGYKTQVYGAFPEVAAMVSRMKAEGFDIECLPEQLPHDEVLQLHGRSRVSLAVSIADGISTSMLEAMALGSFPIQTGSSCANEWIADGKSGFIVDAGNVGQIARRLKRALTDDRLVDEAAERNAEVIRDRANPAVLRGRIEAAYRTAAAA